MLAILPVSQSAAPILFTFQMDIVICGLSERLHENALTDCKRQFIISTIYLLVAIVMHILYLTAQNLTETNLSFCKLAYFLHMQKLGVEVHKYNLMNYRSFRYIKLQWLPGIFTWNIGTVLKTSTAVMQCSLQEQQSSKINLLGPQKCSTLYRTHSNKGIVKSSTTLCTPWHLS